MSHENHKEVTHGASGESPNRGETASGATHEPSHESLEPDAPVPAPREVARSGGASGVEAGAVCESARQEVEVMRRLVVTDLCDFLAFETRAHNKDRLRRAIEFVEGTPIKWSAPGPSKATEVDADDLLAERVSLLDAICTWMHSRGDEVGARELHKYRDEFLLPLARRAAAENATRPEGVQPVEEECPVWCSIDQECAACAAPNARKAGEP